MHFTITSLSQAKLRFGKICFTHEPKGSGLSLCHYIILWLVTKFIWYIKSCCYIIFLYCNIPKITFLVIISYNLIILYFSYRLYSCSINHIIYLLLILLPHNLNNFLLQHTAHLCLYPQRCRSHLVLPKLIRFYYLWNTTLECHHCLLT